MLFRTKVQLKDARKQMLINLEKQLPTFNLNFSFNGFEEYKGAQWVKPYYDDSLLNDSTENNETSTNTSYETPVQGQVNSTTNDHTTSTLPTVNSENTDSITEDTSDSTDEETSGSLEEEINDSQIGGTGSSTNEETDSNVNAGTNDSINEDINNPSDSSVEENLLESDKVE